MREVTKSAIEAFYNAKKSIIVGSNTRVEVDTTTRMYLHNNLIAERVNGKLFISNCGWKSNVTKERLNALDGVSIQQKKGVWYLNGVEWNGERIEVK